MSREYSISLPELLVCACLLLPSLAVPDAFAAEERRACIVLPGKASRLEELAAREVHRYVHLTTGRLLRIERQDALPDSVGAIVVARKDRPIMSKAGLRVTSSAQGYCLKTIQEGSRRVLFLAGNDDFGTLYAAYRLAEVLGVRFYLHGDCIPDEKTEFRLPDLSEEAKPLFALRGIQPFHDFPEGPDWWNEAEYRAVIGQLPKLRMNFIGLHNYPEGRKEFRTEPGVWIGQPADIGKNAAVRFSYPAAYHNTLRGTWGYEPRASTAEFACGASLLFEEEVFGSEISRRYTPVPATTRQGNEVFERSGALLREAFSLARALGVKTCIGTETPLRIPKELRQRLQAQGKNPDSPAVVQELYEGIFRRIAQTYPLDYYWFWTPESWTWEGENQAQVAATTNDLWRAFAAWEKTGAPFQLATCGWVLGPSSDRSLFDTVLPKQVAISCIGRRNGLDPIDEGFSRIRQRGKWAIPWLEDDGAFISAQLWAGRIRRDAADALDAGCSGLMGIHWRTRVIGPNVAALAQAAWQQPWKRTISEAERAAAPIGRWALGFCQPVEDFYADWALHEFGPSIGSEAAALFARLDGQLPRSSDWVRDGPGGLKPNSEPWETVSRRYAFVDRLRALRPRVKGSGNQSRLDYWLNTFEFMRACERISCTWADYNRAISAARAEPDRIKQVRLARERALPLRRQIVAEVSQACAHLLATVSTSGEMGTVANLETHTFPELLFRPGQELERLLGDKLPPDALLPSAYEGATRIIVPALPGTVNQGVALKLKVIVLSRQAPAAANLFWRKLGARAFRRVPLVHVAAGVYSAIIPARASRGAEALEFYIEVKEARAQTTLYPPTAPSLNGSVVVLPW